MSLLSRAELERAGRFHHRRLSTKWSFFHSSLREILGRYLEHAPEDLAFQEAAHGKPFLAAFPQLHFNLSHSGDAALVAVTRLAPVGVDLELPRELRDMQNLAERCFSEKELEAFNFTPPVQRTAAFFNIWTRKEALLKASGLGLHLPLDAFDVPCGSLDDWSMTQVRSQAPADGGFRLIALEALEGYAAALALAAAHQKVWARPTVRFFRYRLSGDRLDLTSAG